MKRDKLFTALWAWALGTGLSMGSVLCLATAFSLTVDNLPRLLLLCSATALGCGILFQLRRGSALFLLVSGFFFGYLWRLGTPDRQLLALVQHISEIYNNAYHWGYLALSDLPQSADYPLMLFGYLAATAVSFWLCRGKGLFPAVAAVLFPVLPCFVVTDTVPDSRFLFLIMAGLALLLLPADLRRNSIPQANRLAALAAVPIVAALALLFLLNPQDGYIKRTEVIRQQIFQWVKTMPTQLERGVSRLADSMDSGISHSIDLASLGPQYQSSDPVMTVTAQQNGALYLRGQDYDSYTGTGWTSSPDRAEHFTHVDNEHMAVTIQTQSLLDLLYQPYYPAQPVSLEGGMISNRESALEYTIPAGSLSETRELSNGGKYGHLPEETRYLALPENTDLSHILSEILTGDAGSHSAKAAAIAAYVQSRAVYDLNPERMPREESDFALWFLERADRGYCVHFATAAVALLRTAGIPARYVTGYLTQTQTGIPVTVTQKEAHAWAEYYEPRLDAWLILEATPADSGSEMVPATDPEETPPAPTETTPTQEESNTSTEGPTLPQQQTLSESVIDLSGFYQAIYILSAFIAGLLAVQLQRSLRLKLRQRKQSQGSTNTQALQRWREAERLSRLLKQTPEEELLLLAQKAKFSQHDLSDAELSRFDTYLRFCRQQLRQKPWYIRLIHQYVYAAY